jgi:Zinc finger, C2H2 type
MTEQSRQGQDQHKCDQCGQTFKSSNELREHQRTHKRGSESQKNR